MYLKLLEAKDIPRFVDLCYNFHQNSPFKDLSFNKEKVEALAISIIKGDKTGSVVITIADDNHLLQGYIVGVTSETPFGNEKVALELAWWVEPEHRGSRKSYELLLAYKEWAKKVNCNIVQTGFLEGFSPESLDKVYTKMGMIKHERGYMEVI